MYLVEELKGYLDQDQRLKAWPTKRRFQELALEFLASEFETGRSYSATEVNVILNRLHTFHQATMLRKKLFDDGLLDCTADGTEYWKVGP